VANFVTGKFPRSDAELARIPESIAEFQRGKSSEEGNYLAKSSALAVVTNEPSFHEASVLFVERLAGLLRFYGAHPAS
jgi:hypothetical protein